MYPTQRNHFRRKRHDPKSRNPRHRLNRQRIPNPTGQRLPSLRKRPTSPLENPPKTSGSYNIRMEQCLSFQR